jgi:hypothetical protein
MEGRINHLSHNRWQSRLKKAVTNIERRFERRDQKLIVPGFKIVGCAKVEEQFESSSLRPWISLGGAVDFETNIQGKAIDSGYSEDM